MADKKDAPPLGKTGNSLIDSVLLVFNSKEWSIGKKILVVCVLILLALLGFFATSSAVNITVGDIFIGSPPPGKTATAPAPAPADSGAPQIQIRGNAPLHSNFGTPIEDDNSPLTPSQPLEEVQIVLPKSPYANAQFGASK